MKKAITQIKVSLYVILLKMIAQVLTGKNSGTNTVMRNGHREVVANGVYAKEVEEITFSVYVIKIEHFDITHSSEN